MRQVASGAKRPAQICRAHGLAESLPLRWRREDEARGEAAFAPPEQKVAEPARCCGQLALGNAALSKGLSALPSRSGTR